MPILSLRFPSTVHPRWESGAYSLADYIVRRIKEFKPTPERPFVMGLPTGGSPVAVYKRLVEKYKKGEVSFANVVTYKYVDSRLLTL